MHIVHRRGWEIPEAQVTPEHLVLGRRRALGGTAGSVLAAAGLLAAGAPTRSARAQGAPRNPRYEAGRELTAERDATTYNNYYEFGTDKGISRAAQRLPVSPWSVRFDGMVSQPRAVAFEDILKAVRLEERIYRHRCVEAWAMTVPWTGFPLSQLVQMAGPLASAKYVQFETLADPRTMPGLRLAQFTWPYVEGVTMAEAQNDLAFVATGLFGKNLPPQNGAPMRLVLPWKYGFKSVKSIVRVTFTDKRPETFWNAMQPGEYGFWANVNPEVAHPRWSQASERLLTSGERVPTRIYNGYGEWVAGLYAGLQGERLFM